MKKIVYTVAICILALSPITVKAQWASGLMSDTSVVPKGSHSYTPAMKSLNKVSPKGALLRSFILPGWGHYYVDKNNWNRGKLHLGAEVILWLSYFGLNNRVDNLDNRINAYTLGHAGVDLKTKSREFELAMVGYDNLAEYNDYMRRTRRINSVFDDTPENQWQWDTREERLKFINLREDRERADRQIPGIVSLMFVNRLLSGINSFTAARHMNAPQLSLKPTQQNSAYGTTETVVMTSLRFDF